MVRAAPYTLVSTISRQNSGVSSLKPRLAPNPALANATSRRPKRSSVSRTMASWSSHSVTSQRTASARSSPPSSWASASSLSSLRAPSTTRWPSAAAWRAVAAPMPVEAPVMRKTLSSATSATLPRSGQRTRLAAPDPGVDRAADAEAGHGGERRQGGDHGGERPADGGEPEDEGEHGRGQERDADDVGEAGRPGVLDLALADPRLDHLEVQEARQAPAPAHRQADRDLDGGDGDEPLHAGGQRGQGNQGHEGVDRPRRVGVD